MPKKKEVNEKALTLFSLTDEIAELKAFAAENDGELSEEQLERFGELLPAIEQKAEGIAHVLESWKDTMEAMKSYEDRIKKKRESLENKVKRLKRYLRDCMIAAGIKSVKDSRHVFSVTVVDGRTSVHIDNADNLPLNYTEVETRVKPLKKKILEALEKGEVVDGASLEKGEPYLTIR